MERKREKGLSLIAILLISITFFSLTISAFEERRVNYETQEFNEEKWEIISQQAPKEMEIEVRFALRQYNLDILEDLAIKISSPKSGLYMRYMNKEDVLELTAPPKADREFVMDWLQQQGVSFAKCYGDWIVTKGTVKVYEEILSTELSIVKQRGIGAPSEHQVKIITGEYSLPHKVAKVINNVQNLDHFATKHRVTSFHSSVEQFEGRLKNKFVSASDDVVIPYTLYNNYNISGYIIKTNSSQCVAEFSSDHSFLQSDLTAFASGVGVQEPNKVNIEGPYNPNPPDGESTLDIQQVSSIGINGTNYFWTTTGWLLDFAQDLLASPSPPLVNSMSWLSLEKDEGKQSVNQTNSAYQKLALIGVTMVASSGDSGACGQTCTQCSSTFYPGYPADSPWVLSVGATELIDGETTEIPQGDEPSVCQLKEYTCAASGKEDPASSAPLGNYATGGGFSIYQSMPSYQTTAVTAYLNDNSISKPPSSFYNAANRGFPDVASNGMNIMTYKNAKWEISGGTSAAAPQVAGMLCMINDFLMLNGKSPLGHVNPLIYQMAADWPSTFTIIGDLTTNNNDGCTHGYTSNPNGWSPVTGLGTLNFGQIISYLTSILSTLPNAAN